MGKAVKLLSHVLNACTKREIRRVALTRVRNGRGLGRRRGSDPRFRSRGLANGARTMGTPLDFSAAAVSVCKVGPESPESLNGWPGSEE